MRDPCTLNPKQDKHTWASVMPGLTCWSFGKMLVNVFTTPEGGFEKRRYQDVAQRVITQF